MERSRTACRFVLRVLSVIFLISGCKCLPSGRPIQIKGADIASKLSLSYGQSKVRIAIAGGALGVPLSYMQIFFDENEKRLAVIRDVTTEKRKFIYDGEHLLDIVGSTCEAKELKDNDHPLTILSFLPDSEIPQNKQLDMIKFFLIPDKGTLKWEKPVFDDAGILVHKYQSEQNLILEKKEHSCTVIHQFTNPIEETPDCTRDEELLSLCNPELFSITIECKDKNDENVPFYVLDFVEFQNTIDDPEMLQQPVGTFCDGKSVSKLPELPDEFSFDVEENGKKRKIWYDQSEGLLRTDFVDDEIDVELERFKTIITDYKHVAEYTLNRFTGSCSIQKLETELPSAHKVLWTEHPIETKIQYAGKRKCRQLDCDVWTVQSDGENEPHLMELYYAEDSILDQDLNLNLIFAPTVSRVTSLRSESATSFERHIFNFEQLIWSHFLNAFDVEPCFNHTQKAPLLISVNGPVKGVIDGYIQSFVETIIDTLKSSQKEWYSLRFADVKFTVDGDYHGLFSATLLDAPFKEVSDITAKKTLEDLMKTGEYKFTYPLTSPIDKSLLGNFVMKVIGSDAAPTTLSKKINEEKRYKAGTLAGMIILGLLLGGVLGVLIIYLVVKKTGVDQFFGRLITSNSNQE